MLSSWMSDRCRRVAGRGIFAAGLASLLLAALALFACAAKEGPSDTSEPPQDQTGATDGDETTARDRTDETADEEDGAADEDDASTSDSAPAPSDPPAPAYDYRALAQTLDYALASYGDSVSVVYVPLDDPKGGLHVRGNHVMRSASMIKLPILAALFEQVEVGTISLDETYTLQWSDIVGGTGTLQGYAPGTVFTIDQLAWHMIAESDNTATNILIDRLGFDAIGGTIAELGLEQTSLQRRMMDFDAAARGEDNYTSADDIASVLLRIGSGTLVNEELSGQALGYLADQTDTGGIGQGLPVGVSFAHKTGTLEDVRHDGGIVGGEHPYVLVVMAQQPERTANALAARVSQIVWESQEELHQTASQ